MRRALVLGLAGVLAACGRSELPPPPVPTAWEGPDTFQLPRTKMRPGMMLAHRYTCVTDEERPEVATLRQIGRQRTARGLTEVRLEIDGRLAGEQFLDDDGRVVDARSDESLVRKFNTLLFEKSEVVDAAFAPLQRNQPKRLSMRMDQVLKVFIPQWEWIRVPPMAITIEYLGQTDLDGRRVAGYSTKGFVEHATAWTPGPPGGQLRRVQMDFDLTIQLQEFRDVSLGIVIWSQGTRFVIARGAVKKPGEYRSPGVSSTRCQSAFDAKASRGF